MAQSKTAASLTIRAVLSALFISVAAVSVTASLQVPAMASNLVVSTDNGGEGFGANVNSGQRNTGQRTVSQAELIAEIADSRPAQK